MRFYVTDVSVEKEASYRASWAISCAEYQPHDMSISEAHADRRIVRSATPKQFMEGGNSELRIAALSWNCEYVDFTLKNLITLPEMRAEISPSLWRSYVTICPTKSVSIEGKSSLVSNNTSRSEAQNLNASVALPERPLREWVPSGQDIVFIGLQECRNLEVIALGFCNELNFDLLEKGVGPGESESEFMLVNSANEGNQIRGYGDGAYLNRKATASLLFVRRCLLNKGTVRLGSSIKIQLSQSCSKGATGDLLFIGESSYLFLNAHLPSISPSARQGAREKILNVLSAKLRSNCLKYSTNKASEMFARYRDRLRKAESVDKVEATMALLIDHFIWVGDFNFRCSLDETNEEKWLRVFQGGNFQITPFKMRRFFDVSDELGARERGPLVKDLQGIKEGRIGFSPTYKKLPGRVGELAKDNYILAFKKRWYKGLKSNAKFKRALPSWSDRVLYWSSTFVKPLLLTRYDAVQSAGPDVSLLSTTDHDPIVAQFLTRTNSLNKGFFQAAGLLRVIAQKAPSVPLCQVRYAAIKTLKSRTVHDPRDTLPGLLKSTLRVS